MGIYTEEEIDYSGSGVLIIEDYYKKNGNVEPCIILVRNKASGEYTDFGGSYELKHGSLQETASIELREESRNLFNIDPKFMTNEIDMHAFNNQYYRIYLLKVNGVSRKYFLHNSKLIDSLHQKGIKIPRSWRETDDIVHIPIKNIDFDTLGARGKIILQDIEGNNIKLGGRTKKVIHYTKNTIINMINQNPTAKRKDMIVHKSTNWTNMTYSYVLK
jgi:hypothetical protein